MVILSMVLIPDRKILFSLPRHIACPRKSYFEVPEEIVEDQDQLASWAREAAARGGKRKAPTRKKG